MQVFSVTRQRWYAWAGKLKQQARALYFTCRDPRTPRLVKALALITVAYLCSPIDLIPDFIPVLGLLDDLLLVPLMCWLVIKLTPDEVWQDSLIKAQNQAVLPANRWVAVIIIFIWLTLIGIFAIWLAKQVSS